MVVTVALPVQGVKVTKRRAMRLTRERIHRIKHTVTECMLVMRQGVRVQEHFDHALHLLRIGLRNPPWTFVNLLIYATAANHVIRRGAYASMWATMVAFDWIAPVFDST